MNAVEKCLRDMLDRRPWVYIKKNHTQGTIYRSLEKYEPQMEQLFSELSQKCDTVQQEEKEIGVRVLEASKVHEEMLTGNQSLLKERDQVSLEINSLVDKKNTEEGQLQAVTSKLGEVQEKLSELGNRNLTSENLSEVLASDIASSSELLERVRTKVEHKALLEQNQHLDESLNEKQKQEKDAAARLDQLQADVQSEKNVLDELKMQNRLWIDSVHVANKAQEYGYTPDILVQVLEALFHLGVKDEPVRSARRLLRRFEKISEEIELDHSISRKTAALESIEARYDEVAGGLEAIKKSALGSIKEVQDDALKSITIVEATARRNVSTVADQSSHSIRGIEQSAVESVEKVWQSSDDAMDHLKNGVSKIFMDSNFTLQLAFQTYQKQVSDWGDLREQAGRYTELIKLASVLLGIQQNPDAILDIDPQIICRLAQRIDLYIAKKWPGVKTKASTGISRKDWGISSVYEAELSSVSSWLVEALKQLERGGS